MLRMKVCVGSLLMLALSTATLAECVRPQATFQVPEGTSANAEQMAAAQQEVIAFAGAVTEYVQCLQGELGQKSIGKNAAEREKLVEQYASAYDAVTQEAAGYISCFNAQLESFKTSGGGNAPRSADCKQHIAAAANRSQSSPSAEELVIEASGHSYDLESGRWLFLLARDGSPRRCGPEGADQCFYRAVVVLNESNETLECTGEITYEGTDLAGQTKTSARALVLERSTRMVTGSYAKADVNASVFDARCTVRAKLPPLDTPATCKYEVVTPVAISDYYPPASRAAGEEGPVTVEFSLPGKAAHPQQVRAVASSLYPALDEAAVRAVSDMVMSSNCPNARYRLRLTFRLQ
jgi:TonB family C-terminal domain